MRYLNLDHLRRCIATLQSCWFRYRDNRNNTAHDYGEAFARETLILIPGFLDDVSRLADRLQDKLGEDAS